METAFILVLAFHLVFLAATHAGLKLLADTLPRTKGLSLQFAMAAGIAWLVALSRRDFATGPCFIIMAIGFLNAFGAYSQWRAYRYSLSKTALFLPLPGILAAVLAAMFLGETSYYRQNLWLLPGTIMLFLAAFLFSNGGSQKEKGRTAETEWLLCILAMVIIWGGAVCLMRYFALSDVPKTTFLKWWYTGSFFGSLPLLWLEKEKEKRIPWKGVWKVFPVAVGVFACMATEYWAFQLAPLAKAIPIITFGTALLPIPIGWWLFGEKGGLTKRQIVGFVLGALGLAIIIFSNMLR